MDGVGGSGTSQPLSKPAGNPRGRAPRGRAPKDSAPKDSAPRGRAKALRRTAALFLNSNGIQPNCVSTEIHKVCNAMALFDSPRGPPLSPTGLAHPTAMDPPAPLPRSPSPSPALPRQPRSAAPTAQLSSHSAPAHPAATDPPEPLQRRSPLADHPAPRRWNPWPGGPRSERIGPNSIGPGRGLGGHVVW